MRRASRFVLFVAVMALVGAPKPARADGFFAPFMGVNFANNSFDSFQSSLDAPKGKTQFGFDAGWMGAGIAGMEFDFGYGPNFFGTGDFGGNHVLTAMGNLIIGIPIGGQKGPGIRPFGSIGVGLVQTRVDGAVGVPKITDNGVGMNGGFGVMGFFGDHVGLRGDVRYFRNFKDAEISTGGVNFQFGAFHYWRASLGLVLR